MYIIGVLDIGKEVEVGGIKDELGTKPIVFYSIRLARFTIVYLVKKKY